MHKFKILYSDKTMEIVEADGLDQYDRLIRFYINKPSWVEVTKYGNKQQYYPQYIALIPLESIYKIIPIYEVVDNYA